MNKINFELVKGSKYLLHLRESEPVECIFIDAMKFSDKSKTRYLFDRTDCNDEVLMMTRPDLLNAIDFEHYEIKIIDPYRVPVGSPTFSTQTVPAFLESNCCGDYYILSEGEEGTNCYLCTKCNNACDPCNQQVIDSVTQTNEKIIGDKDDEQNAMENFHFEIKSLS